MARHMILPALSADARNGCFESMLLHARSLIDFVVRGRGKPSDLHRSDFVGDWSPPKGKERTRLLDAVPVLNKHLAHLTWERVSDGQQEWKYHGIAVDVLHVIGEFVAEAAAQGAPGHQRLALALDQAQAEFARKAMLSGAGTLSARTNSSGHLEVTDFRELL